MQSKLVWLAAVVASVLVAHVAGQCSDEASIFRFKLAVKEGIPSYITAENATVNVLTDTPMPPIIVSILFLDPDTNSYLPDFSFDGKTVDVEISPKLRIGGNSVEIAQGEAIFTSLLVQEQPEASEYRFIFSVSDPNVNMKLETGKLNFVPSTDTTRLDSLRFGNYGYIFRAQQDKSIPVNQPMPMFFLEGVNSLGHTAPLANKQITVTVTTSDGVVSPNNATGSGAVTFDDFTYTPSSNAVQSVSFTFTATDGSQTVSISTRGLSPEFEQRRNQYMLFDPTSSFFAYDNVGDTAVKDLSMPPIVLQLYTSTMQPDRSQTGLVVIATSEQGTLQGGEALFVKGRATFADLQFVNTAPRSAIITFTAGSQGSLPVENSRIYSGAVQVAETSIKAKHLSFAKSSFVQVGEAKKVQKSADGTFVIPSIVIQVKDSAYQMDSTANGIVLKLVVEPAVITANPATATVVNGIAAFSNVKFSGASAVNVVQKIKIVDEAGIRAQLDSALISLALGGNPDTDLLNCASPNGDCKLRLKFGDSMRSYVYEEDQEIFATIGGKVGGESNPILVEILDEFGNHPQFDASNPNNIPKLVAFTSDTPQADLLLYKTNEANEGTWRDGYYEFGCLIFNSPPSGLVRISFRLLDRSSNAAYRGIPDIRTGFVTIAQNPTPNFGLKFAKKDSLVSYPGQSSSAVVNIAIPTIVIELIDSLFQEDDSNSDIVIVASTSSGQLDADGIRETVSKGKASFSTLKFTSIGGDEPIITFTAQQSSDFLVAGKSISTGPLTVTTLPIRAFEIVFLPAPGYDISHGLQPFLDVAAGKTFSAQIGVRDSAHQLEPEATETVQILVSSTQANIRSTHYSGDIVPGVKPIVNFTTELLSAKPAFGAEGTSLFISYTVNQSSNPLLTGKSITVGPIQIGKNTNCPNQLSSPTVVAEFKMTMAEFEAQEAEVQIRLAYMMGVERSRVELSQARLASGIDHSTLERWTGTKVDIKFTQITDESTNRKPSAQLASEFVALRPTCEQNGLCIANVYLKESDKGCNLVEFRQQVNQSEFCTETSSGGSQCDCFGRNLLTKANGKVCSLEPILEDQYYDICRQLSICPSKDITSICDPILKARAVAVVWLWATLGAVGGVVLVLLILKQRGLSRGKDNTTLHNTVDNQY